jgi:hypothetical protein
MLHDPKVLEKVNRNVAAAALGVHPSTLSRKVLRDGCPRNKDGSFNLIKVFTWVLDQQSIELEASCESEEGQRWMDKYREERARLSEIERKKAEGLLIEKSEIAAAWAARVDVVTAGLEAFRNRLPPLLAGKSRLEIANILSEEVYQLRNSYATKGRYCPEIKNEKIPS